jgi:AcrR family transcriptional regulator
MQNCIKLRLRMKRKRMTQAERREETREQVLAAAARIFAQRGFHGTSLDAVAEEAGFSRGAVYYNFADKDELFLELLDKRCAERAEDLREVFAGTEDDDVAATSQRAQVFAGTEDDDVAATSRRAQVAADHALDAMTTDTEWRALYLEFLAHAARDTAFRRRFAKRCAEMRGALDEVVTERTAPVADALGMEPEQLSVVIDALASGLMTAHMVHGSRAVPSDLLSKTLALLVDGIAARAGVTPQATQGAAR